MTLSVLFLACIVIYELGMVKLTCFSIVSSFWAHIFIPATHLFIGSLREMLPPWPLPNRSQYLCYLYGVKDPIESIIFGMNPD